jgi:hypothetical protein
MFSFTRLQGADPTLGVEMMSTGEVACFGVDMYEAFLLSMMSAGLRMPNRTRAILFSLGAAGKAALTDSIRQLQKLGYGIYATEGTRLHLEGEGGMTGVIELAKPSAAPAAEGAATRPTVLDFLREKKIDLFINDPAGEGVCSHAFRCPTSCAKRRSYVPVRAEGSGAVADGDVADTDGFLMRRTAVDFGVSLITNMKAAALLALALERVRSFHIRSMEEFYAQRDAAVAMLDAPHDSTIGGTHDIMARTRAARDREQRAADGDASQKSPHRTPSKTGATQLPPVFGLGGGRGGASRG